MFYLTLRIVNADYYPFGSEMPGRTFNSNSYRYAFNGKENDNEIKGTGNQYDYGFRIYDPRIGKFLSVDPLTKSYPWYTPYQFAGNKPINSIDLDGLEEFEINNDEVKVFDPVKGEFAYIPVKSLTIRNIDAAFKVIDENGVESKNFKYCEFICQMKGFQPQDQTPGGDGEKNIQVPNHKGPTKRFTESSFRLLTTIGDPAGFKALPGGLESNVEQNPLNVLGVGAVPEEYDRMKVFLPTKELQNEYKKQWAEKGWDKAYKIDANEIIFIDAPERGTTHTKEVIFEKTNCTDC
ncbi:MAG: RHS repeat-associated core domain-containing protein [Bacteroidota bacterium]|nr:RHS repeat-associated core domain-containing protein [Bacteroidota bacterium]